MNRSGILSSESYPGGSIIAGAPILVIDIVEYTTRYPEPADKRWVMQCLQQIAAYDEALERYGGREEAGIASVASNAWLAKMALLIEKKDQEAAAVALSDATDRLAYWAEINPRIREFLTMFENAGERQFDSDNQE